MKKQRSGKSRIAGISRRLNDLCRLTRFILLTFWTVLWAAPPPGNTAEESIKIKIIAVNPSDTKNLKTKIEQILPPELKPDDVLDKAGMEVRFDPEKKQCWLTQEVELTPKETRTFEVAIRNVWAISGDEIGEVRAELEKGAAALKTTKYAATGKLVFEKAMETLGRIEEEESKAIGIKQRIELYRAHRKELDNLRTNTFSLLGMQRFEEENKSGVREVQFMIVAQNPSDSQTQMMVRSLLPKEITGEDVLNKQGFKLLYDEREGRHGLEREDSFGPKEEKKYVITLRDVWFIPAAELGLVKTQTEKLMVLFKGSPYEAFAKQRGDYIQKAVSEINLLQTEVASSTAIEDRARAYVLNSQRLEMAKKKMHELQDMVLELSLKQTDSAMGKLRNLLVKKLVKLVQSKSLVVMAMGVNPNTPMVWWLIIGTLLFLALLSGTFYFTWLKKLQEQKWIKKKEAPAKIAKAA